jgi:tetratricopeptide (TPR) repeat protein
MRNAEIEATKRIGRELQKITKKIGHAQNYDLIIDKIAPLHKIIDKYSLGLLFYKERSKIQSIRNYDIDHLIDVTEEVVQAFDELDVEYVFERGAGYFRKRLHDKDQDDELDEATRLNNQVLSLHQAGKYAEALPLARRSLAIRESSLSSEDPRIAKALNNLGRLYQAQDNFREAEASYRRALNIWEKALGLEHPSVATGLNNLGALYRDQGRYAEAEPILKQSLAIWEKVLGPEDPYLATTLTNIGFLYCDLGRYAESEPLLKGGLTIREKVLGPEHADVADSLHKLGVLYNSH